MDEGIPVCAENEDKNNWRRELGFQRGALSGGGSRMADKRAMFQSLRSA